MLKASKASKKINITKKTQKIKKQIHGLKYNKLKTKNKRGGGGVNATNTPELKAIKKLIGLTKDSKDYDLTTCGADVLSQYFKNREQCEIIAVDSMKKVTLFRSLMEKLSESVNKLSDLVNQLSPKLSEPGSNIERNDEYIAQKKSLERLNGLLKNGAFYAELESGCFSKPEDKSPEYTEIINTVITSLSSKTSISILAVSNGENVAAQIKPQEPADAEQVEPTITNVFTETIKVVVETSTAESLEKSSRLFKDLCAKYFGIKATKPGECEIVTAIIRMFLLLDSAYKHKNNMDAILFTDFTKLLEEQIYIQLQKYYTLNNINLATIGGGKKKTRKVKTSGGGDPSDVENDSYYSIFDTKYSNPSDKLSFSLGKLYSMSMRRIKANYFTPKPSILGKIASGLGCFIISIYFVPLGISYFVTLMTKWFLLLTGFGTAFLFAVIGTAATSNKFHFIARLRNLFDRIHQVGFFNSRKPSELNEDVLSSLEIQRKLSHVLSIVLRLLASLCEPNTIPMSIDMEKLMDILYQPSVSEKDITDFFKVPIVSRTFGRNPPFFDLEQVCKVLYNQKQYDKFKKVNLLLVGQRGLLGGLLRKHLYGITNTIKADTDYNPFKQTTTDTPLPYPTLQLEVSKQEASNALMQFTLKKIESFSTNKTYLQLFFDNLKPYVDGFKVKETFSGFQEEPYNSDIVQLLKEFALFLMFELIRLNDIYVYLYTIHRSKGYEKEEMPIQPYYKINDKLPKYIINYFDLILPRAPPGWGAPFSELDHDVRLEILRGIDTYFKKKKVDNNSLNEREIKILVKVLEKLHTIKIIAEESELDTNSTSNSDSELLVELQKIVFVQEENEENEESETNGHNTNTKPITKKVDKKEEEKKKKHIDMIRVSNEYRLVSKQGLEKLLADIRKYLDDRESTNPTLPLGSQLLMDYRRKRVIASMLIPDIDEQNSFRNAVINLNKSPNNDSSTNDGSNVPSQKKEPFNMIELLKAKLAMYPNTIQDSENSNSVSLSPITNNKDPNSTPTQIDTIDTTDKNIMDKIKIFVQAILIGKFEAKKNKK